MAVKSFEKSRREKVLTEAGMPHRNRSCSSACLDGPDLLWLPIQALDTAILRRTEKRTTFFFRDSTRVSGGDESRNAQVEILSKLHHPTLGPVQLHRGVCLCCLGSRFLDLSEFCLRMSPSVQHCYNSFRASEECPWLCQLVRNTKPPVGYL